MLRLRTRRLGNCSRSAPFNAETNRRDIMGDCVNNRGMNLLGWITTISIFAASIGPVITWFT